MEIATLSDLFSALDELLEPAAKAEVARLPQQELGSLHLGLDSLIRSWAYNKNSSDAGRTWFLNIGLPDEGSSVLASIYWLHLRNEPVSFDRIVEIHKADWTPVSEQLAKELAKSYASVQPLK